MQRSLFNAQRSTFNVLRISFFRENRLDSRIFLVYLHIHNKQKLFMRRNTTILALLLFSLSILAGPITPRKAATMARTFMSEHPQFKGELTLAHQKMCANGVGSYYYIYNTASEDGFVIVSGDDRVDAILGYCDTGRFDPAQMPENMRSWLGTYERAIDQMDRNEMNGQASYVPSTETISPLLTTRWDQGYPYNIYCPENCPTGCVATAMAQVMYYHRWPQEATSAIPGYTSYSRSYERPALPDTTFAWSKMRNTYGAYSSTESREAVALLMEYVGTALEMDYEPSGSGAQTYTIPYLLQEYFGYSGSAWEADRSEYSISEWDELLLNELRAQRPVLYTGYTSNWEGHAFVCDGYDGAGMFHINWGWGGYCDGYYRISLLDPDGSGIGGSSTSDRFSMGQSAIIGWSPEEVTTNRPVIRTLTALERPSVEQRSVTRESRAQDFPSVTIRQYVANGTGNGYFARSGYGLYKDGEMIDVLHSQNMQMWPTQVNELSPAISFGANLDDGDYEIFPISTHLDNNQWEIDRGGDHHFIRAHIAGNEMTLTPVPLADFQVNEVSVDGNKMSINLTNPHEEYNGSVTLYTTEQVIAEEQVAIAAGETTNIYLYISKDKPLKEGDIFYLSVDRFDGNHFYSNGTNEGAELSNVIAVRNMSEVDGENVVYGGKLAYDITLQNQGTGLYHYTVDIALRDITRDRTINGKRFIASIAPATTETFPTEIIPTNNMYGRVYQIEVTHMEGNTPITTKSAPFKLAKGAVLWYADGGMKTTAAATHFTVPEDVVAAELSTAFTKDVTANSNPNTIYLLGDDVPDGLLGHNVVNRKGQTGKLEFYDGHPYFLPISITANALYYHRTIGWDESSWTTLMLPFAPETVSADGSTLSWPRSHDDADGDLYMLRPTQVSQDGIATDYASEMEPFRPYILTVSSDLRAKELVFSLHSQSNVPATIAADYKMEGERGATFHGTFKEEQATAAFMLDGPQMTFHAETTNVPPFRFYLTDAALNDAESLPLLLPRAISTGITQVDSGTAPAINYIYNTQGQRVGTIDDLPSLPHGIYIIKGKKTIH